MKRFITYVFEYDNGVKGRNVGFIKADIRGNDCRMEIHLHNWNRCQGKGMVYLLAEDLEPVGIPVGEMVLSQGHGDYRQVFRIHPVLNTGYDFSQVAGAAVRCNHQDYAASFWREVSGEEMQKGRFRILSGKEEQTAQRKEESSGQAESAPQMAINPQKSDSAPQAALNPQKSESAPQTAINPQKSESAPQTAINPQKAESTLQKPESAPQKPENTTTPQKPESTLQTMEKQKEQPAAGSKSTFRRINLSDIKSLPRRNWYLCNNSFLLHGFLNYHYLVIKKTEEQGKTKYYLGVPGIYEKPERVMALLFGFPEFEAVPKEGGNPRFGYWLCSLDM